MRALCSEQGVCKLIVRKVGVESVEGFCPFLFRQIVELLAKTFILANGREQAENRIDGGVVQKEALAELGFAHIHDTFLHTTTDAKED